MNSKAKKILVRMTVVIVVIGVVFVLLSLKRWRWKNRMEDIVIPEQVAVLGNDFFMPAGTPIGGGSDDDLMYVYCWFVKSELSMQELDAYFSQHIELINESGDFSGWSTAVYIHSIDELGEYFSESIKYGRDRLGKKVLQIIDEYGTENIYLGRVDTNSAK